MWVTPMQNDIQNTLAYDLLTGARAIGAYLGWKDRKVYYAHEQQHLPIQKVGETLVARKSELIAAVSGNGSEAA